MADDGFAVHRRDEVLSFVSTVSTPDHGAKINKEKSVYETRGPILDGQLGTAHIGIWASSVDREVYRTLFMFVWPITLALFAGVIIAVFLARQLIRALRRLIELRVGSQATSPDVSSNPSKSEHSA